MTGCKIQENPNKVKSYMNCRNYILSTISRNRLNTKSIVHGKIHGHIPTGIPSCPCCHVNNELFRSGILGYWLLARQVAGYLVLDADDELMNW
jgi:hypothetical protein